jgi:hypothetical protein
MKVEDFFALLIAVNENRNNNCKQTGLKEMIFKNEKPGTTSKTNPEKPIW